MRTQSSNKRNVQLIWGIALILVGIAVFFQIPEKMSQVEKIQQFKSVTGFIRVCLYLMGVILLGGGIKKIIGYFQSDKHSTDLDSGNDETDKESSR